MNHAADLSDCQNEDWDRSFSLDCPRQTPKAHTVSPHDSVTFPEENDSNSNSRSARTPTVRGKQDKRSLSELLRLHAEKGTDVAFTREEALRVADVLGQWINASSSPYEGEDDFFSRDDLSMPQRKPSRAGRPRGKSESISSKPSSSTGLS